MSVTNYQSTLRCASENLRISSVWPNGYCDARKIASEVVCNKLATVGT